MNPSILEQMADGIESREKPGGVTDPGPGLETLEVDRTRRGAQALRDPKQSADHSVPAGSDLIERALRALNTVDMLAGVPDGHVMTDQDAQAIREHAAALRAVLVDVLMRGDQSGEKPHE
jgi:hypothetical protein